MRYSSHRSETAILSTKCRRRMAAFSSGANVRRARFLLIRDPSLLHRVEPEGVTFQLNRNTRPSSAGTSSITITCGFTARSDGSHQRISWLAAKARSGRRETSASRPLAKLDESGALALEDRPQCVTPHIGCHVHAEPKQTKPSWSGSRNR